MSTSHPEHNLDQVGTPVPDIHSNSQANNGNYSTQADANADININRNRSSSYSARSPTSTALEQLQRYGATNAHLVNLGRKRLKAKGLAAFEDLDKAVGEVDAALRILGSSVQLFGSSVGVMHAVYQLRKSLLRLRFHFRENAACLYEPTVKPNEKRYACQVKPEMKVNGQINELDPHGRRDSRKIKANKQPSDQFTSKINKNATYEPGTAMENKCYRTIIGSMDQVKETLAGFVKRINEISGFHDELINRTFASFAEELDYRVGAFERLSYPQNRAFREHINELAAVFGQYLNDIHHALKSFQKASNSIPIIQRAQEQRNLGLQALSAVATFFSGITASAIQYQQDGISTPLKSVVNGLWIMSLACSVASAVSAQVVYFWCTSRFSSPSKYTPRVIGHVLKYTPLVYLGCSVSAFMTGLSVFTFSSAQHIVVSVLVVAFTVFVSFKLVAFGLWIALERLAYSWTGGEHWFLQIHNDTASRVKGYTAGMMERLAQLWVRTPEQTMLEPSDVAEKGARPQTHGGALEPKPVQREPSPAVKQALREFTRNKKLNDFKDQYIPQRQSSVYITHAHKQAYIDKFELSDVVWQHHGLIKHLAFSPEDQSLLATCGWDGTAVISRVDQELRKMTKIYTLNHDKNTQGQSPSLPRDGLQLSIFDRPPTEETCVREITWSPDGKKLATRTRKTVRIWNSEDGKLLGTIQASASELCTIEAIVWASFGVEVASGQNKGEENNDKKHNGEGQKDEGDIEIDSTNTEEHEYNPANKSQDDMRVESSLLVVEHVYTADQKAVESTSILQYRQHTNNGDNQWLSITKKPIENTKVISVGVVDESRLAAVGEDTGGNPKSEVEKYIFLFNYILGEMTSKAPLTGAVRNISVTVPRKNVAVILVTYKHQGAYPQLWSIKLSCPYSRNQHTPTGRHRDFSCVQSYFSKETADFSGRGCFGGQDNSYVCCSSQEGEIFVWDRVTGLLVGTINPASDEHIKFFTCSKQACPDFKCASGAVDGILSLWTVGVQNAERTSGYQFSSPEPLNSPEPEHGGLKPYISS